MAEGLPLPPRTNKTTNFRGPSTLSSSSTASSLSFEPTTTEWMSGPWHVTHSTLPMWKTSKNVQITYTPLAPPNQTTFDNLVTYNPIDDSNKQKSVAGIEKPDPKIPGAWNWRGKGLLMVASSHWELLGWGVDQHRLETAQGEGGEWMVTYFEKTLFTPAGIDILTKRREGVSETCLGEIKGMIKKVGEEGGDEGFKKLAGEMFEVLRE